MYVWKPSGSTSYHYDIYNPFFFFLQHRFFCGTCVSMCRLQYVTFPGPPPHSYIGLRVPRGILSDRCLLPNANWITPVWLSLPEGWGGGQLATGLLSSVCLRGRSADCGTVVCLCRGPKSFTWHSLAEEQKAQMLDLWKEISAVSRVLALISCKTTQECGWMSAPGRLLCQHQHLRALGAPSVGLMCMFLCMRVPWPAAAWAVNKR